MNFDMPVSPVEKQSLQHQIIFILTAPMQTNADQRRPTQTNADQRRPAQTNADQRRSTQTNADHAAAHANPLRQVRWQRGRYLSVIDLLSLFYSIIKYI